MAARVENRPTTKGVGFSDHLIVLGHSDLPPPLPLPKANVFVHRGEVAAREMAGEVHADHPDKPRSISAHFEHTVVEDDDDENHHNPSRTDMTQHPTRTSGKRRARFFEPPVELISDEMVTPPRPYDEPVETSCTDSEEDTASPPRPILSNRTVSLQHDVDRSTRINTKLNSLPSGGTFSFMNSSEDVDMSSSDDDDVSASRKMIRVDGSAKLSSASGLGDEDFEFDDVDEFAIEGAERVDEEEAVNVRSFGRSFARVCLKDDSGELELEKPTKWASVKSPVAFDIPMEEAATKEKVSDGMDSGGLTDNLSAASSPSGRHNPLQQVFAESRSAPPRRKSRMRITFVRRASNAGSKKNAEKDKRAVAVDAMRPIEESVSGATRLSCFPLLKSPTKTRLKGNEAPRPTMLCGTKSNVGSCGVQNRVAATGGASQLVAIPDMNMASKKPSRMRKSRKIIKNVSMQRDDWIDFATNSPQRQRSQWLTRFLPTSSAESEISSRRESRGVDSEVKRASRGSKRRFWRRWGRK